MLELPQINKEGLPYISHSQYSKFNALKAYRKNYKGIYSYMSTYFFRAKRENDPFSQFGTETETYLRTKETKSMFNSQERKVLDRVKLYGESKEFWLDMGGFMLNGIYDDYSDEPHIINDIKTKSKSSVSGLKAKSDTQLDVYALNEYITKGKIPKTIYTVIERKGGKGIMTGTEGRESLQIGSGIEIIERTRTETQLIELKEDIIRTAHEISEYYKIFKFLNS